MFKFLKIRIFYWKELLKQLKKKQKKKKKGGFLGMLLGTSKASLLTGKGVWRIGYEDMKEKEY